MAQAEGGGSKVTCPGAPVNALGPSGPPYFALSGYCPRNCGLDRRLAAARLYCKLYPSEPGAIAIRWPRLELRLAESKTYI